MLPAGQPVIENSVQVSSVTHTSGDPRAGTSMAAQTRPDGHIPPAPQKTPVGMQTPPEQVNPAVQAGVQVFGTQVPAMQVNPGPQAGVHIGGWQTPSRHCPPGGHGLVAEQTLKQVLLTQSWPVWHAGVQVLGITTQAPPVQVNPGLQAGVHIWDWQKPSRHCPPGGHGLSAEHSLRQVPLTQRKPGPQAGLQAPPPPVG